MRPLKITEQKSHAKSLKKFVDKINRKILSQSNFKVFKIQLMEVGYGIKVDDQYVYFDFPFNEKTVPQFNEKLINDPYLKDVDEDIHNRYFQVQKLANERGKHYSGYIYYKYKHNLDNNYQLIKESNNLKIDSKDLNYLKFLPIMDCAMNPNKTTYDFPVELYQDDTNISQFEEIIILSKRVGKDDARIENSEDDNLLLCTFKLSLPINKRISTLVIKLYDDVFYFLESYFKGPILEKIMLDKRKSYILGYKHTINSCFEDIAFKLISDSIKSGDIDEALKIAEENIIKAAQLKLFHSFLFDYEFYNSGYENYPFKFAGEKISKIILFFNEKVNLLKIGTNISIESDFTPKLQSPDGTYELFDLCLILWNLWFNACSKSTFHGSIPIDVFIKFHDGKFVIIVKNTGLISETYMNYINGIIQKYPNEASINHPYRGLQVIRDIINGNRNMCLRCSIEDNFTIMTLTINRHENENTNN